MSEVYQEIKIICQIDTTSKKKEGNSWRKWRVHLVAVDDGKEVKGKLSTLLDHVEYVLHPTFPNPRRAVSNEPYLIQEKGWGEFDMRVILFFKDNLSVPENIFFDLNFSRPVYKINHKIIFEDATPELVRLVSTDFQAESSHKRLASPTTTHVSKKPRKQKQPTISPSSSSSSTSPSPVSSSHFVNSNLSDKDQSADHDMETTLSDIRAIIEETNSKSTVVDDIYREEDLDSASPIHSGVLDEEVRKAWGIPEDLDIVELARKLSYRTIEQTEEIEDLIRNNRKDGMIVEENDDEFIVDLYSLGPDLLKLLWDYAENNLSSQPPSTSSSPLVQN